MKNNSFKEIYEKLKSSKRILLSLHRGPDGDSIGSCMAMAHFLKRDFKSDVTILSPDKPDKVFEKYFITEKVEVGKTLADINLKKFDVFLALDCADLRMVNSLDSHKNEIFTINIDHHPTNTFFGNMNYIQSGIPSTSSILLDFFKSMKVEFDKGLAQPLMLGVCSDSYFFRTVMAEQAIEEVEFLLEKGASYLYVLDNLFFTERLNLKKYFSYIVDNVKVNSEGKFGYTLIPHEIIQKFGITDSEINLGIREIMGVEEFDFVFTLAENHSYVGLSFRSKKNVDVSAFAKALGGGGHRLAAGGRLEKMHLKDAEKKVLDVIKNVGIQRI